MNTTSDSFVIPTKKTGHLHGTLLLALSLCACSSKAEPLDSQGGGGASPGDGTGEASGTGGSALGAGGAAEAGDDSKRPTPPTQPTKLQVFILSGQSNMEGFGYIPNDKSTQEKNGGLGTLTYLVENDPETYGHLGTPGDWIERDDVWIVNFKQTYDNPTEVSQGPLTVNYGAFGGRFGPELQFGHVMGDHYDAPVLLIKTPRGNRSLAEDFRPPSSGETGLYYEWMVDNVHEVLDNLPDYMPSYDGGGYEIAGFAWNQGYSDRKNFAAEYQGHCVNLINDLRAEFGESEMPFVLATTGMDGGWELDNENALTLIEGQLAVPTDPGLNAGLVTTVETRGFWRDFDSSPRGQGYHWNQNAESFFLIGDSMAQAMLDLYLSER